MQANECRHVTF